LAPPKFEAPGEAAPAAVSSVALATTEPGHMTGFGLSRPSFRSERTGSYQVRPTGNAVNIEEQMMKVAANQMDYRAATAVYMRSLNLIKTAVDKK
jgi:flagellar basal-body rod protein FlgB